MDTSPLNPYLLFSNADEFSTSGKVAYALRHPADRLSTEGMHAPRELREKSLISSVKDLERVMLPSKSHVQMVDTVGSQGVRDNFSTLPEGSKKKLVPPHVAAGGSAPWENESIKSDSENWNHARSSTDAWNRPVLSLYQQYTLLIAIDFGISSFCISEGGVVLVDNVPRAIEALLNVINTCLATRRSEMTQIKRWLQTHLEESEWEHILHRVWSPAVKVTIILINVPALDMTPASSPAHSAEFPTKGATFSEHPGDLHLFPETTRTFLGLKGAVSFGGAEDTSWIPLVTQCDAEEILHDTSFVRKLGKVLSDYEEVCRSQLHGGWPDVSLLTSIEHLVSLVPERSSCCTSVVFLNNASEGALCDNISLLESAVRRKSIILSILFLGGADCLRECSVSALSRFLLNVGGVAFHLNQWFSLASPRLNIEWCRCLGGPRCLSQQLFVQLDANFPVNLSHIPQTMLSTVSQKLGGQHVLYDSSHNLEDFALANEEERNCILQCVAGGRINEGWSVVMNYIPDNPHAVHLNARFQHKMRRGKLFISYEMNINYPIVYRRVCVSGTQIAVEQFIKSKVGDRTGGSGAPSSTLSSWTAYLAVARNQLHGWMRAEELALHILRTRKPPLEPRMVDELRFLSPREGVSSWWLSYTNVRSIGVFTRWDDDTLSLLHPHNAYKENFLPPIAEVASRILRAVLKEKHHPLGDRNDDEFVSIESEGRYVVQIFRLDDMPTNGEGNLLAVAFELRFSFFVQSTDDIRRILTNVATSVRTGVVSCQKKEKYMGIPCTLVVKVDADEENERELCLYGSTVSPKPLEQFCARREAAAAYSEYSANSVGKKYGSFSRLQADCLPRIGCTSRSSSSALNCSSTSPYVISPWVLADTLVLFWVIETTGKWGNFTQASFNLFVSRRVREGFRLLYCMTQCKALLHASYGRGDKQVVDVFDLVIAPSERTDGQVDNCILLYRFVRPFRFTISPAYENQLNADVLKDIQAISVLHTFETLSSLSKSDEEGAGGITENIERVAAEHAPQLELLLPFCRSEHGHRISVPLYPHLRGKEPGSTVEEAVRQLLSMLGDACTTVKCSDSLPEDLWQRLSGGESPHGIPVGGSSPEQMKLLISALKPADCTCVMLLLCCAALCGEATDGEEQCITIHVFSLGVDTLYDGVMRLYGHISEDDSGREGSHCCEASRSLLSSLTELFSFYSSFCVGQRFLQHERANTRQHDCCTASLPEEVLRVFAPFQDYWREIDVSHLLFTWAGDLMGDTKKELCEADFGALTNSILHSASLKPLMANRSVFLHVGESVEDSANATSIAGASISPPFIMKMAFLYVSEDDGESACAWIFTPVDNIGTGNNCVRFLSNIFAKQKNCNQNRRLLLQFFIKAAPSHLSDLANGGENPERSVVKETFGKLQEMGRKMGAEARKCTLPLFFMEELTLDSLESLRDNSVPYDTMQASVHDFFDTLIWRAISQVARCSLDESLRSQPFKALRDLVIHTRWSTEERSVPSHCAGVVHDCVSQESSADVGDREAGLRFLAHVSKDVLDSVNRLVGLRELLSLVVAPALLCSPEFTVDLFTVEFVPQGACNDPEDSFNALHHIFTHFLPEDRVCIMAVLSSCFLVVPNAEHFGSWWFMVATSNEEVLTKHSVRVMCSGSGEDAVACKKIAAHFRRLVETKVREVSQLQLLKKLSATQSANNELIPPLWGNQFDMGVETNKSKKGPGSSVQPTTPPTTFHCQGKTVLQIPVYYKLQHQCRRLLSRITSKSSKLELITIYNREQCFLVADDVQRDTFHYIRLVFVKDTSNQPSVSEPSPRLSPADRCPLMVVQLFSATKNASAQRPLQKLEDFFFLLAVQELQGHLNYVQHKVISAVDLIFLQYNLVESACVDLRQMNEDQSLVNGDEQLALALIILGFKEKKFRQLEVEEGHQAAVSNFIEHYALRDKFNNSGGTLESTEELKGNRENSCSSSVLLRFVKVIEGATDILVSCSLSLNAEAQLSVNKYVTKAPEEQSTMGEAEKLYLSQIDDVIGVGVSRWRFFVMSRHFSQLTLDQVLPAVDAMVNYCARTACANSAVLQCSTFSLDRVIPAVFPSLIERLTGVFEPLCPICFECKPNTLPNPLQGFPWCWNEQLQSDPYLDHLVLIITCGYQVLLTGDDSKDKHVKATRALRVSLSDLSLGKASVVAQNPFLLEHAADVATRMEPHVLVRISLTTGLEVTLLDLHNSDVWLRLVGHVLAEAERESDMLHDLMVQRMGFGATSCLSESSVAEQCGGIDPADMREGRLSIHRGVCRWTKSHLRLPRQPPLSTDPLAVLVEGLCNRGLLSENTVKVGDAVKVLYNECPTLSLKECHNVLQGMIRKGIVKVRDQMLSFCCDGSIDLSEDVATVCVFRKHVHSAHQLIESQHWHRGNTESLRQIEMLWGPTSQENEVVLAKVVVSLQSRSKQIYGSRVPDFTMRSRTHWRPSYDILSPSLPRENSLHSEFCPSINAALQSYVHYICGVFQASRVIDLNPRNAAITSDATLLSRLRCRYGKTFGLQGDEVAFVPHLFYVLVPIVDVLKIMGIGGRQGAAMPCRLPEGGLFIVEMGFQVVHFALDVFMVSGSSLCDSTSAHAATWFKKKIMFSSVLYDLTVLRLLHCVQMYTTHLPGQLQTSDAVQNLVKYYPNPPRESVNMAAMYGLDESRLRRIRRLPPSREGVDVGGSPSSMQALIPEEGDLLTCEFTGEKYQYSGLVLWSSSRLLLLICTVRDATLCERQHDSYLSRLALRAKQSLLNLLTEKALQSQLEFAWERFRKNAFAGDGAEDTEEGDALHCLRVLQARSVKFSLHNFMEPFLHINVNWRDLLSNARRNLWYSYEPDYALHLINVHGVQTSAERPDEVNDFQEGLILTLGACGLGEEYLVAVEFDSHRKCDVIKTAALYRHTNDRSSAHTAMTDRELQLVECVLRLLSSALWNHEMR